MKGENTQYAHIKPSSPFYDFILSDCVCEIYGAKGTGKTCLLLHLAE